MVSGSNKFPQFSLYLSLKLSKWNAIGKSVILFCFMLLLTQHHYMILFSSLKVFPLRHCHKVLLEQSWKNYPGIKVVFNSTFPLFTGPPSLALPVFMNYNKIISVVSPQVQGARCPWAASPVAAEPQPGCFTSGTSAQSSVSYQCFLLGYILIVCT